MFSLAFWHYFKYLGYTQVYTSHCSAFYCHQHDMNQVPKDLQKHSRLLSLRLSVPGPSKKGNLPSHPQILLEIENT